jgi:hypothetical protein
MANENTTGEPLKATLADQLGEKAHLEDVHEQEKHASDPQERRVEKKKEEERRAAAEHAGFEAGARRATAAAGGSRSRGAPRRPEGAAQHPEGPARVARDAAAEPSTEGHAGRHRTGFQFPWAALAIAAVGYGIASSVIRGVVGGVRRRLPRVKRRRRLWR